MLRHFGKRELRSTELTWEERHPIDYLFGPSDEDLDWLRKKIKMDEESIQRNAVQRQDEEKES